MNTATSSETPAVHKPSTVLIDLLGTSFSISTDESPEYMESLIADLRQRMTRLSGATKVTDPLRLSILTGIVLLDELKRSGVVEEEKAAESLFASLNRRLHEAGL